MVGSLVPFSPPPPTEGGGGVSLILKKFGAEQAKICSTKMRQRNRALVTRKNSKNIEGLGVQME